MAVTIALDAMGGDFAPEVVLVGASIVLQQKYDVRFILFGDGGTLANALKHHPSLHKHTTVVHAGQVVTNFTKPSEALRQAATSGMGLAIKAVAEGQASAVVSAGNTGAYMALSRMFLKTLPGVGRPAIAKILPTKRGKCVVLDLGANAECKLEQLVQFAVMGSVLAEYAGIKRESSPTVGLLNIGSEASKGLPILQETAKILKNCVNFHGFVEGNDITEGTTDIVVADGFSGNIALKSIEGTAGLIRHFLKEALSNHWTGKLGYFIARKAFKNFAKRVDPRLYNGAILLGLRGIAVKSHGGTDALGYSEAIKVALELATPSHGITSPGQGHALSFNRTIAERIAQIVYDA